MQSSRFEIFLGALDLSPYVLHYERPDFGNVTLHTRELPPDVQRCLIILARTKPMFTLYGVDWNARPFWVFRTVIVMPNMTHWRNFQESPSYRIEGAYADAVPF